MVRDAAMFAKSFNLSISQDMSALWNVHPVECETYPTGAERSYAAEENYLIARQTGSHELVKASYAA